MLVTGDNYGLRSWFMIMDISVKKYKIFILFNLSFKQTGWSDC